jgi:hypothetical protein
VQHDDDISQPLEPKCLRGRSAEHRVRKRGNFSGGGEIRNRALALWDELKEKALEEDQKGTGQYAESERRLAELDK